MNFEGNRVPLVGVVSTTEETTMEKSETYREYAADCRRLAGLKKDANEKAGLTEMAEAWEVRATEAERLEKKKDGKDGRDGKDGKDGDAR
jgi:hypothetical protein